MRKYIVLLILPIFIGCKKDLTGHWHAQMEHFEYRIDIENNKDCYMIYSFSGEPSTGKHISSENRIEIYAQSCGAYDFNYEIKNNLIFIKNYMGKEIILEERPNCNKIDDFKTKLSIDFLKPKNSTKDSVYNSLYLNEYINIGFYKKDSTLAFETSTSNKLHSINTIDSLSYEIEPNYSEAEVPFINYILTPDKNIKANDFNKIIQKLNKNGKKKIYIRTLKDSFTTNQRDLFEYIKIREGRFDFNSRKTLEDIIN